MSLTDIFSDSNERDTHKATPIPERFRKDKKVAIITGDNVEDTEFFYPYYRLTEAGYDVDVITEEGGKFEGKRGLGLKESKSIESVDAGSYALLYLPGGKAPAALRKNDAVLAFVRQFAADGTKPVAAICHGVQILITAGLIRGKQVAAWPEIREEVEKAGATFVNEALVEDGQFITARMPGDLPRHLSGVLDYLEGRKSTATPRGKLSAA